jgi:dienelactone hydrolase
MRIITCRLLILTAVVLLLAACKPITAGPSAVPPAAESTAESTADLTAANLPAAVEYNLGDAVVIQDQFPAGSSFREMPVRLNGLIAVPEGDEGPYPVVVILHGTHPGCPAQGEVDTWPCALEDEQPNYRGFAYLASELAARGYVALALNINAENTFGFGEPVPNARLRQIVDLHLSALAAAAAGSENNFGVELAGRADVHRLALFGHSRGGESTVVLANDPELATGAEGGAYGPAAGTLLIAPASVTFDPAGGSRAPSAIVISGCDGDVVGGDGQFFYEGARLAPGQTASSTSVYLGRANHNAFNSVLGPDPFGAPDRPDCATLLDPQAQRAWLVDYAADFLTTLFSPDPAAVRAATIRMGMFVFDPAPAELYGQQGRVAVLAPANRRQPLFVPAAEEELAASPAGGSVASEGISLAFCRAGWDAPQSMPEACRRMTVTVPGQPAHAVATWEQPGGALRITLPPGVGLLNFFDALTLRAAVDPLSPLNATAAPHTLSVQLTDGSGNTAVLHTRPGEPALQFPNGNTFEDDTFGAVFTGLAPLTTIRFPLRDFGGVNLMDIVEVAVLFDGSPTGALFLADIELVRSTVGFQETLDAPPSPEKIAAAEAGDVEAMRQLANVYRPTEALGVTYGNLQQSVFWYRQACAAGYANAQVDFYQFARAWAETTSDMFLPEAIVCLEDAIAQGHRSAILDGAFRAAYIDFDYPRAWYLYALLEESDPDLAAQRHSFADQLTQAEIDAAETAAAAWRAENTVKDYDDFFAAVNSPFRP